MKIEKGTLKATPTKRTFQSIMADYNLNSAICELIDNALDLWVDNGKKKPVNVTIDLDNKQQTIVVKDNVGGIKEKELVHIVGLGRTGNDPGAESIGIFGVGTKRAVVYLAQDISITSRYSKKGTFRVEFGDEWLKDESWDLKYYEVYPITTGSTVIELKKLRVGIDVDAVERLKEHLSSTYGRFLTNKQVIVKVNDELIKPISFDNWAYPPGFEPQMFIGVIKTKNEGDVGISITAGLADESSPAAGEYGVYVYCNSRLIARGLKSFDVGFGKGQAGLPHASISIVKVIVTLQGPARLMPWNSSKSGVNPNHPIFQQFRDLLVKNVKDFATLSRSLVSQWTEAVFQYQEGEKQPHIIEDFPAIAKTYLPEFPKGKKHYIDKVSEANKVVTTAKPWTSGLLESIVAVDVIERQDLKQRNRIALILLDSTLEIGLKEYLVNDSGIYYDDKKLLDIFGSKYKVETEVKKTTSTKITPDMWKKVHYYSNLRNKFVHERASVSISDNQIDDFRLLTEKILSRLFGLNFQ